MESDATRKQLMQSLFECAQEACKAAHEVKKTFDRECINWGDFKPIDVTYQVSLRNADGYTIEFDEGSEFGKQLFSFLHAGIKTRMMAKHDTCPEFYLEIEW